MSDCNNCPVEKDCHYPYKPCDCVHQRKFWDKEQREEYDKLNNPVTPMDAQDNKNKVINFNFGE